MAQNTEQRAIYGDHTRASVREDRFAIPPDGPLHSTAQAKYGFETLPGSKKDIAKARENAKNMK